MGRDMDSMFEGTVVMYSGAAVWFHGVYWEGVLIFPLSQVTIEPDNEDTGHVVMSVRRWLASKRGLLEFTHYSKEEIEAMNAT